MPKKQKTESQEQQRLVLKLRWLYPDLVFFAIPNGGYRRHGEATKMRLEGVESGTPDLFIAEPSKSFYGLFIELKRQQKYKTSKQQIKKMNKLSNKGYYCAVCYGANHALEVIKFYLNDQL